LVVLFDHLGKRMPQRQVARTRIRMAPRPQTTSEATHLEFLPMKPAPAPRAIEALEVVAILSEPPVARIQERETVTIQMAVLENLSDNCPAGAPSFEPVDSLPAFTIDAELWDRLISSIPEHDLLTPHEERNEPERVIETAPDPGWPSGMIPQPALESLIESEEPFTGLVVSIGINDMDGSLWHRRGMIQSVSDYIAAMLNDGEFACRTAFDEFVLVRRGVTGASAQRHLNQISEQFWHYQLRDARSSSILFSWDGVHVQDEPLAEAIAAAMDRMRQAQRLSSTSALLSKPRLEARAHSASL
jgi:hypothetical protein